MSTMNLGDFDFGFTTVTAGELEEVRAVTAEVQQLEGESKLWKDKANNIYNAVLPLLNNLATDPEKDYIYWPDRTAKIDQFKLKLKEILES